MSMRLRKNWQFFIEILRLWSGDHKNRSAPVKIYPVTRNTQLLLSRQKPDSRACYGFTVLVCVCANLNQFLQPAQRGFLISMLRVRAARWSLTWAGWASFTKECSSEKLHDRNRNRFYCRRRGLGVDLLARYAAQCLLFEASEFLPFWSGF